MVLHSAGWAVHQVSLGWSLLDEWPHADFSIKPMRPVSVPSGSHYCAQKYYFGEMGLVLHLL